MTKECFCWNCDEFKYSEKWDAYYCNQRNIWLEIGCGSKTCHFKCGERPKYPNMKRYNKRRREQKKREQQKEVEGEN